MTIANILAALVPTFVNINMMFADSTSNHLWLD
jgi:hypothetical protein